jgi:hypothetical protein
MHTQLTAEITSQVDAPELVLECYGRGYALLRPEVEPSKPEPGGRWDGTWPTYLFQAVTTFALVAPSRQVAADWFVDEKASIELVDCDAMTFDDPTLIGVQTDGEPIDAEPRYAPTDLGRRALALEQLLGPWPTVADTIAARFLCGCSASGDGGRCPFSATSARALQDHYRDIHHWSVALCRACAQPQSTTSCAAREHWGAA